MMLAWVLPCVMIVGVDSGWMVYKTWGQNITQPCMGWIMGSAHIRLVVVVDELRLGSCQQLINVHEGQSLLVHSHKHKAKTLHISSQSKASSHPKHF